MQFTVKQARLSVFDWLQRHQIWVFIVLAYSLSWSVFITLAVRQVDGPIVILGVYGPSVAAILLTWAFGGWRALRDFLRRALIWRVGIQWYLFVTVGFVMVGLLGYGLYRGTGGTHSYMVMPTLSAVSSVFVSQMLIPGIGEEFGWRGFALPRLQSQLGAFVGSIVLAILHVLWHFPAYWLSSGVHNVPLVLMTLWAVAWTLLFTWVYNNTRGSILIAALYHSLFGVTLSFMPFLPSPSLYRITPALITSFSLQSAYGPYIATTAIYWGLAIIVGIASKWRFGYD